MNRTRINALISVGEHIKCSPRATIDTTSPPPLVGRWQPRTAQRRSYEKRAAHEASWQGHEFSAGAAKFRVTRSAQVCTQNRWRNE
jgi:hypothetical protein